MQQPLCRPGGLSFVALFAASLALLLVLDLPTAQAQVEGKRVEFSLTVDRVNNADNSDEDPELRVRRQREINEEVIRRIETRLEAMGLHSHNVRTGDNRLIRVTVYGRHSEAAIKSAIIPPGRLEIRPVLVDGSPWLNVAAELPPEVDLIPEPGSFRTDRLFLFSHSARHLREAIATLGSEDTQFEVFPHEDGWRTLHLGSVAATERDISDVSISRNPSGIPFVSVTLSSNAAQDVRADAAAGQVRHLAIIVDGEVVALHRFSDRRFSETLDIDPPRHLSSTTARNQWAMQVAGRLAAPLPIRLAEMQE